MSLYQNQMLTEDDDLRNIDLTPYIEAVAYDDLSKMTEADIKAFVESDQAQVLVERQVLNKKTLVRLSKKDELKRRIKLIAYKLAHDDKNPHWDKMCLFRSKWKKERAEVMRKYGNRASKLAKVAQKEYIKKARKEPNRPSDNAK